jgi:hypothetical protein
MHMMSTWFWLKNGYDKTFGAFLFLFLFLSLSLPLFQLRLFTT